MNTAIATLDKDALARLVTLVFGTMEKGGRYWCYVAVKPSRFDEFQRLSATKTYNIQSFVKDGFGEVLVSGEGDEPPVLVTKQLAQILGVPIRELFTQTDANAALEVKLQEVMKLKNNV